VSAHLGEALCPKCPAGRENAEEVSACGRFRFPCGDCVDAWVVFEAKEILGREEHDGPQTREQFIAWIEESFMSYTLCDLTEDDVVDALMREVATRREQLADDDTSTDDFDFERKQDLEAADTVPAPPPAVAAA